MEAALAPGQLLANRYRVDGLLGVSDLAHVYAAVDLHGNRECALKVLPASLRHAPAWNTFESHSRAVAALNVDHVARVFDLGVDSALGQPFVSSERVTFPSLAASLSARGALPPELWCKALSAFARALDAAAGIRVAHGSIKPENLFFSPERPGWARIADFGVNALRAALPGATATPGSLGWAASEQLQSGVATPASDIFALGLVSYCVLTGRHYLATPWQASPSREAVLAELLAEQRPSASERARAQGATLRPELDAWFARALHRDPAARFASAAEAAAAFEAALAAPLQSVDVTAQRAASPEAHGVAAAVAAPLLFQELPRPVSAAAYTPSAPDAALSSLPLPALAPPQPEPARVEPAAMAPLPALEPVRPSSRPPGYAAPRASTTEHIPGLPTRPPVALFAALGISGLLFLSLAAYAVLRVLLPSKQPAPTARSALPSAVSATPLAMPALAAPAPSASALTAAYAHFECTPRACEWLVCDGEKVKQGTIDLPLAPGKHSCSGSRHGFRTAVTEFSISRDGVTNVKLELVPIKATTAPARSKLPASRAPRRAAPAKLSSKSKPQPATKSSR